LRHFSFLSPHSFFFFEEIVHSCLPKVLPGGQKPPQPKKKKKNTPQTPGQIWLQSFNNSERTQRGRLTLVDGVHHSFPGFPSMFPGSGTHPVARFRLVQEPPSPKKNSFRSFFSPPLGFGSFLSFRPGLSNPFSPKIFFFLTRGLCPKMVFPPPLFFSLKEGQSVPPPILTNLWNWLCSRCFFSFPRTPRPPVPSLLPISYGVPLPNSGRFFF